MISNLELKNMDKVELVNLLKRVWRLLWADEKTKAPEYRLTEEELLKELLLK